MLESIRVKYRTWHGAKPPKPIKLQIPGWSGCDHTHDNGSKAQPWHCQPFVDGSTYGLELCYPFRTECHAVNRGGRMVFEGDFADENRETMSDGVAMPPFACFAEGHFGMTSCVDLEIPDEWLMRIESHPRFYTDYTGTAPVVVPGHIQSSWWSKIFFVVFKNPAEGQRYVFRHGEPYAQIIFVGRKVSYQIEEMTEHEKFSRGMQDNVIKNYAMDIAGNSWTSEGGHKFDDKYKKLSSIAAKHGCPHVKRHLEEVRSRSRSKIRKRLLRSTNENITVQDIEEGEKLQADHNAGGAT